MMRLFLCLFILICFQPLLQARPLEKKAFKYQRDESTLDLSFYFFPEFFYGKNLALLNNANQDEIILFRHFLDTALTYTYGTKEQDIFKAKCGIRTRSIWGNNISVLETTDHPVRELRAVFGAHRHGLVLNDMWIRELWFEASLNDLLCLPFCHRHVLTCGAFFFEIGRGISLGAFYPSLPAPLGFFIDAQIDQYAFGSRLSGELVKNSLAYDIYGAIWRNNSATFDQTTLNIRLNEYGHCSDGARGFGIVNYVVASRLKWHPLIDTEHKKVYFEPYAIYNYNPEIRFDFLSDGVSHLATFGLMGEFQFGSLEWGFEYGFNRGHLNAIGIDRNTIILADDEGEVVVANDQVIDTQTGFDALVTPENQHEILCSPRTENQNNKPLTDTLKNKKFRFRDPFEIRYRGSFFVVDASYIICKDVLKVSAALGIATGDEDPRRALALGKAPERVIDYNGFITLNESYAGKRVTSTLFFNGFGAFPRVFDIGLEGLTQDITVNNITGFTNLIYAGASLDYYYKNVFRTWRISPNLLFFWQEEAACRFESKKHPKKPDLMWHKPHFTHNFLGTELNILGEFEALKDLTFFALAGIFIPGYQFKQIKGLPLNGAQHRFITEKKGPREPLLGNDCAYFYNIGLKYTF